jgi:hypothetical protein
MKSKKKGEERNEEEKMINFPMISFLYCIVSFHSCSKGRRIYTHNKKSPPRAPPFKNCTHYYTEPPIFSTLFSHRHITRDIDMKREQLKEKRIRNMYSVFRPLPLASVKHKIENCERSFSWSPQGRVSIISREKRN